MHGVNVIGASQSVTKPPGRLRRFSSPAHHPTGTGVPVPVGEGRVEGG
jgi:hypothetical protein